MTYKDPDQLRYELEQKERECKYLKEQIEQIQREHLKELMEVRQGISQSVDTARSSDKIYFDEQMQIREDYHTKKVNIT